MARAVGRQWGRGEAMREVELRVLWQSRVVCGGARDGLACRGIV